MTDVSTPTDAELLPCPFCGHVGLDFAEGSTFRWIIASCGGCGASIPETRIQTLGDGTREEWMSEARSDAVAAWNRRTSTAGAPVALEPRHIRKFLQALQAGEMSVSRAIEILDAWVGGYYEEDMVPPPPPDSCLIADDEFPMEIVRKLRAELAAAPQAPQPEALTSDQQRALREANCIASEDGYFAARPQIDTNDRRKVFQAGFERGWEAHGIKGDSDDRPAP